MVRASAIANAASHEITGFPELLVPLCPPIAPLTGKKRLPLGLWDANPTSFGASNPSGLD
jgi:hypothetical protein